MMFQKLNESVGMAIVGDKKWEAWLTKLADPFFAGDAKYYHSADVQDAWAWLRE